MVFSFFLMFCCSSVCSVRSGGGRSGGGRSGGGRSGGVRSGGVRSGGRIHMLMLVGFQL